MSSENRVIDKIERLYAKAEKANTGGSAAAYEAAMLELHSALVGNWPALRDRLREAERRAKAFDAIASGDVELYEIHRPAYWTVETTSDPLRAVSDPDLLTAIEAALSKETT